VPLSSLSQPGRLATAGIRRAGPAPPARCFAALPPGNARLFTGEFVRGSFLVRRASALGRDCALCLRIHRGKSAWRLSADAARASRFGSAVISAYARSASASSTRSASLVHSIPLVVGLVRHYRSPCRDIRLLVIAALGHPPFEQGEPEQSRASEKMMRKRQAAISGRGRTACRS
jgi:hypothetical protein